MDIKREVNFERRNIKIIINLSINENSKKDLAFIRALLIKYSIENLKISFAQKKQLREEILEYLKSS